MIRFMRFKLLYFALSLAVILPGAWSLVRFGLRPAIDFTGGALIELEIQPHEGKQVTESALRDLVGQDVEVYAVQQTGEGTVMLRTKPISEDQKLAFTDRVKEQLGGVVERRFESVGPTIGRELLQKTVMAVVIAALLILIYVAYRFKELKYGICAILAMFHDTLVILGSFSLLGHFLGVEVDTLFVTAVLTILSFSVHDTIVVYDRIRESRKRHPQAHYEEIVNLAVAETLGRSLNNSLTIIFMLTALLLFGGVTIRWFATALLIGTVTGTYSSTFTAAPLLVIWENFKRRKS
ncbi:MAG: protein-export membrane protein SecF [Candidatus Chisholmbacteria bacterium RIFCSPLOWO2_01_FULL_50_28]|uniref:Protein-export membrane protein SecF n=1 Tax=Candidatus Chisholmbacteria bacterium RIFCSPHIGHO2_01_FULL_52_32 TaxID=1797591 RepID=A0A1G1VU95_9BACT|nr:MAG: protein-export membrane protein SecF [Candidatus Chisholmbacteria bacterium RIFCSPHIGHO2_01_FULL_52_32]OGY19853.1 MAG: protein-export membrane protein SecF [Candidatus Chisholmbacteria bacterium RIFCSPLOWO2_01_FULL_50_28]